MPPSGCWLTRRWVKRCSTSTAKPFAAWPPMAVRGTSVVHFTSSASRSSGDGRPGQRRSPRRRPPAGSCRGSARCRRRCRARRRALRGVRAPSRGPRPSGAACSGADATAAAGLPAVHDLALVAEVLRVELGGLGLQHVLALGEELVVGGDDTRAEPPVGEVGVVGEGEVRGAVVGVRVAAAVGAGVTGEGRDGHDQLFLSSSRPVGSARVPFSTMRSPRSQVDLTTPCRVLPAYAVTWLRWWSSAGSTVKVSSGARTAKSASRPASIAPLLGRVRRAAAGCRGHPADDVLQGAAAPAGLGPDGGEAELEGGDAAPGGGEVRRSSGRWCRVSGRRRCSRWCRRRGRPTARPGSRPRGSAGST